MKTVLNIAFPLFGLIFVGYLCGLFRIFTNAAADSINTFVIVLALPALVFVAMARITSDQLRQIGFAAAYGGSALAIFGLGFWLSQRSAGRDTGSVATATIVGLDASYSNVGFMGIPLCQIVFGAEGLAPAIIATLFTACVQFLAAILLIESDRKRHLSFRQRAGPLLLALLRNPLFLAPIAGICVGLSGLSLPLPIARFGDLLGAAAAPTALICIGVVLAQEALDIRELPKISVLVVLKLAVQPALAAFLVFHVLAMPPVWASVAVILSALPTGPGAFILAKLYDLEPRMTSGTILVSHLVSVVTLSAVLAWLT